MTMEPWSKVATPRKEVREDEFAIALKQGAAGTAPGDYHAKMLLRISQ